MEDIETVCFQLISYVGSAKSCYMEAIDAAENNNFDKVDELIKEGDELFNEAHTVHFGLIQREANKEEIPFRLLLLHAEDQLMATETIKLMAERLIKLYQEIKK
ncbi:PTS lactose/cellobiose transporter subunit IIA [Erysipelotrichaceae bacterium HCN-30851]